MRIVSAFAIASALICLGIYEANATEHGPHTHGVATMNVAIEKKKVGGEIEIEVDLDIPGTDLVGFEGKAQSKEHKARLKQVTDLLTKDYSLFQGLETADCKVVKRKLDADHSDDKTHTDYEYEVEYRCKDISKVTELDVNLFRDIQSLTEIKIQLVTETGSKAAVVTPTKSKFSIK